MPDRADAVPETLDSGFQQECTDSMRVSRELQGRTRERARSRRRPATAAAVGRTLLPQGSRALLAGDAATQHGHLIALQRSVGNRAAADVVGSTRHGKGISSETESGREILLHGSTKPYYNRGHPQVLERRVTKAAQCGDCAANQPCLRGTGRLVMTYRVHVDTRMPPMPKGLTRCQRARVRAFLKQVLRPHEDEHARRLRTYNGTTSRPVSVTACGIRALRRKFRSQLKAMRDSESAARAASATELSKEIDPFTKKVDLDCEDKH